MYTTQTFPQLSFAIDNQGQENTIYITTDPAVNKLIFTIKTNTDNTSFTAGSLVPPDEAPATTGSLLYLDLSALQIPDSDFQKIVCSAPDSDWQFGLYPNSIICMVPINDVSINANEDIKLSIDNLILPNPPSTPNVNLSVSYYRVSPITIGNMEQLSFFKVLLQASPDDKKDLHEVISCGLTTPPYIVNTIGDYPQVENNITFGFMPGANPVVVKSGRDTTFTVSFVYAPSAPGYGALTTPQSAQDNIVVAQGENASAWNVTPNMDSQNPCWILQPPPNTEIVGTGVGSIVSFYITEIVTNFEPGSTLMYVQYQNVPGFNDGAYYLTLTKIPHVVIKSLTVTPNPSVIKNGEASVIISWEAKDYKSLMLMPFYQDVTGKTSFKATLKKSTVITIMATGAATSANQATMTQTADVLPVINSFTATPTDIYYNDYPHEAKFYWDVDTNDTVLLVDDATGTSENVPKSSTKITNINTPGMWSLIPQNEANPYTLMRNVVIHSYKIDPQSNSCNFNAVAAVASPSAEFISVLDSNDNTVRILNSLDFSQYTDPIPTGGTPVDQVFSRDGSYLFVLNSTGSLAIINIIWNSATGTYTFNTLSPISIDGAPVRIAISYDGKYIFVTTALEGYGKFVVIENHGAGQFSIKQSILITQSPAGIAVDPAGVYVYIAMTGDNSIVVMGYSSINDAFMYSRSITNLPQNPKDVAVADPSGKTLLVACYASNVVMVVDYDDDGTSPRQALDVRISPIRIATTPDRAYAFVVNYTSNDAALISCYKGTGNCKVLQSSIKTGSKPTSISVAYDGTTAYVTNSDKSVTAFNLINYQLRNTPVNIGKQPTNVTASNDGAKIVMWHNVLYMGTKPNYTKGIFIYETASGTVSTRLDDNSIIKCVFSPAMPTQLMYLIQQNDANVTIMETAKFTVKSTIPIPVGVGGVVRMPVELGMSADTTNLYVVTRDPLGKYSFLAFKCDESKGVYTLKTDSDLFTNASTANNVMMQNTPDGNNVFVLSALDKKIWCLKQDTDNKYILNPKQISLSMLAKTMVAAPDNNTLYVILQQNLKSSMVVVNISDLTSEEFTFPASYATLTNFQQAVASPDGTRLFITDANSAGVRVMSTATLRIIQTLSWQQNIQYPMGIAMLQNASSLYITGFNSNNMAIINQIIN